MAASSCVSRCYGVCDVVGTPSPLLRKKVRILSAKNWPTPQMFKKFTLHTRKWRDIPLGVYGLLDRKDLGQNDYGPCSKLQLLERHGETFWVWAFERILTALDERPDTTHILNNGLVPSEVSEKKYFDFLLYTIPDDEI